MRILAMQLIGVTLLCGLRVDMSRAQAQSLQAGRLSAAAAAVVHEMEAELVDQLFSPTQEPWRFAIASPDSADWKIVFGRLGTMLNARAPRASDNLVHYVEVHETRIADTASVYDISVGVEYPCEHRPGVKNGGAASTSVTVALSYRGWTWHQDGLPIMSDPGIC